MIFFLLKGREVELFLGCSGESGVTEGGGKELTFTCLEKRGFFFLISGEGDLEHAHQHAW